MKKKLVAAAAAMLSLGVAMGQAQATLIDGTWSASVSDPINAAAGAPSPISISATLSFDTDHTISALSLSDFTSNFGATAAFFSYFKSVDQVQLIFTAPGEEFALDFDSVSTAPTFADDAAWTGASAKTGFTTQSGSFAPASTAPAGVPEPASLSLLGTALLGLGAASKRRRGR